MKKCYWLFLVMFLILMPIDVKGLYCPNSDKARLKDLASNINISYTYKENNNNALFSITFNNLHPELIVKDVNNNKIYSYGYNGTTTEMTLQGYDNGKTYQFIVYTNNYDCSDEILYIHYVTLPTYNPFYKDKVCNGVNNYRLCQKWTKHGLNYNDFVKEVESYKKSLIDKDNDNDEDKNHDKTVLDYIGTFLEQYYYYILIVIIIVCLVSIYRINKKDSFGF